MDLIGVDCQDIIGKYAHNLNLNEVLMEYMFIIEKHSYGIDNKLKQWGKLFNQIKFDQSTYGRNINKMLKENVLIYTSIENVYKN